MLKRILITLGACLWVGTIGVGFDVLNTYDSTPGAQQKAPLRWPTTTNLKLSKNKLTLLMMLHPNCACSKASVTELTRVLTKSHNLVETRVLFSVPENKKWGDKTLWNQVKNLPGVELIIDE